MKYKVILFWLLLCGVVYAGEVSCGREKTNIDFSTLQDIGWGRNSEKAIVHAGKATILLKTETTKNNHITTTYETIECKSVKRAKREVRRVKAIVKRQYCKEL